MVTVCRLNTKCNNPVLSKIRIDMYMYVAQQVQPSQHMKTCLPWFANNTGADQPAHPRSLISAFVILFLESFICKLATGEILIF